ncbi:MAG: biliverdin-producing heme oxygenase [Opitutales bacterium]|nr:biliverdin-producing heme oxygenase [Opitutales bacterium]
MNSSPSFAERLKKETRRVHTMAEKTAFMRGFLRGTSTVESYTRLLRGLVEIYRPMEAAIQEQKTHPVLSLFHFPAVFRVKSLEKDLAFLAGPFWESAIAVPRAAVAYRAELEELAERAPELLPAHAYTRYMGDVSGGQILKKIAANSMGLAPNGGGLDFYEFPQLKNLAEFKLEFRTALNMAVYRENGLDDRLIKEANTAFRRNIALFRELEGGFWSAFLRQFTLVRLLNPGLKKSLPPLSASGRKTASRPIL